MPKQGSKSGKSSKTARVLNLLTDPDAIDEPAGQAGSTDSSADGARLADDRRTQARIRGALEMELSEAPVSVHPAPRRPAPPPVYPSELRIVKEMPLPEFPAESEPEGTKAADMPESIFTVPEFQKSSLEATMDELRTAGEEKPDEYICFNVTQALVEDKADKYIGMFNLCSCPRCRIDVIALALSNLPPKYVVARPDELIPRLSMYEQKYNAAVVTQVMSACRKVLERPHHKREDGT